VKGFLRKHAWLRFRRSATLSQDMMKLFFMGLMALYLAISLMVMGLAGSALIEKTFPEVGVIAAAGAILLYYLPIDILIRYFFQKYPSIEIQPYLILPIPRKRVSAYLLFRSLLSFFNFIPFFALVPFLLAGGLAGFSSIQIISFLFFALGLVVLSNYISFWITKGLDLKNYLTGIILVGLILVLYFDYEGYISVFPFLLKVSSALFSSALFPLIVPALAVSSFLALRSYFAKKLYVDSVERSSSFSGVGMKLSWFGRFGLAGRLMDLELRLILRSKRARAYLFMSIALLVLPFIMFMGEKEVPDVTYLFISLFLTGGIAMNHGQLMLSWNSMHFDLLMTRGVSIKDIFTAKYYFLVLTCVLTFLLSLPYLFFFPKLVLFNVATLLFNASFSILIYMLLASYNSMRIDPDEGGAFSFSGFGMAHYLIGIPIIVVPMILYYAAYFFGGMSAGIMAVSVFGLAGVLAHKYLIQVCTDIFKKNRYKISSAFRNG
jgi:hypothetical protein